MGRRVGFVLGVLVGLWLVREALLRFAGTDVHTVRHSPSGSGVQ